MGLQDLINKYDNGGNFSKAEKAVKDILKKK